MIDLLRGDVVLTRSGSRLARLIRKVAGQPVSHAGVIVAPGTIQDAQILESTGRGPTVRPFYEHHKRDIVWIYRPLRISPEMLESVCARLEREARDGEPYGTLEFVTQGLDALLGGANVFRRLSPAIPGAQCASLIAQAFARVGYRFGRAPYSCNPLDMMEHITANPSDWGQILGEHLGKYVESGAN
jgi:hypothetical protein